MWEVGTAAKTVFTIYPNVIGVDPPSCSHSKAA
jgi:hypothetical protein